MKNRVNKQKVSLFLISITALVGWSLALVPLVLKWGTNSYDGLTIQQLEEKDDDNILNIYEVKRVKTIAPAGDRASSSVDIFIRDGKVTSSRNAN